MLSGILHFSQTIRARSKSSEVLFIQFGSHLLPLCYTSNMQTPWHSTRRESVIPEKEMACSLEIKICALLSMNVFLVTAQGGSFRFSSPTSHPNFFPRVAEYEMSNVTLQWQNFNELLVHQKRCSSVSLLSVAMYTRHLCNTASHPQGCPFLGSAATNMKFIYQTVKATYSWHRELYTPVFWWKGVTR